MFFSRRWVGIVVLATSSFVFAQTAETKPGDAPSKRGDSDLNQGRPNARTPDQVEILTETMGVDFGPYLAEARRAVRANWMTFLPPSVFPPIMQQGKVAIEFVIRKDGRVSGMKLHNSSGDVALDRAAWASITASNPFPPLPTEFQGQTLGLRFYYFYNPERNLDNLGPVETGISISPSVDVRVVAGSMLQFSASGKGITDTSVRWTVSGVGCSKSACGTISLTGLYAAPLNIPNPPTVWVEAASIADSNIRGHSTITVVQANPSH